MNQILMQFPRYEVLPHLKSVPRQNTRSEQDGFPSEICALAVALLCPRVPLPAGLYANAKAKIESDRAV